MNLELHVWRQAAPDAEGSFVTYEAKDISPDMSFLEMLDVVNEGLVASGSEPIAFDHDCREGICGSCGLMINGVAHGPMKATATCQLHMRHFEDGEVVWIEPWRARAFPVVKDLVVNRGALDRIIAAGGFISVNTGSAPEANSVPVPKQERRRCDGRRGVHRVRRVRRRMSERLRLTLHRGEDLAPRVATAGSAGAKPTRAAHGRADGRRGFRALHALRRVPGGVPEGNQHRHDRADES